MDLRSALNEFLSEDSGDHMVLHPETNVVAFQHGLDACLCRYEIMLCVFMNGMDQPGAVHTILNTGNAYLVHGSFHGP